MRSHPEAVLPLEVDVAIYFVAWPLKCQGNWGIYGGLLHCLQSLGPGTHSPGLWGWIRGIVNLQVIGVLCSMS